MEVADVFSIVGGSISGVAVIRMIVHKPLEIDTVIIIIVGLLLSAVGLVI